MNFIDLESAARCQEGNPRGQLGQEKSTVTGLKLSIKREICDSFLNDASSLINDSRELLTVGLQTDR